MALSGDGLLNFGAYDAGGTLIAIGQTERFAGFRFVASSILPTVCMRSWTINWLIAVRTIRKTGGLH